MRNAPYYTYFAPCMTPTCEAPIGPISRLQPPSIYHTCNQSTCQTKLVYPSILFWAGQRHSFSSRCYTYISHLDRQRWPLHGTVRSAKGFTYAVIIMCPIARKARGAGRCIQVPTWPSVAQHGRCTAWRAHVHACGRCIRVDLSRWA